MPERAGEGESYRERPAEPAREKRRSRRSARPGLTSRETMEETKTILIIEAARITEETITGILPDAVIRRTTPAFMQEARKAAASRGQTEAM